MEEKAAVLLSDKQRLIAHKILCFPAGIKILQDFDGPDFDVLRIRIEPAVPRLDQAADVLILLPVRKGIAEAGRDLEIDLGQPSFLIHFHLGMDIRFSAEIPMEHAAFRQFAGLRVKPPAQLEGAFVTVKMVLSPGYFAEISLVRGGQP